MEKLQQLLSFCDSSGKAITFFDGKFTLSQVLAVIGALVIISLAIKFIKGVFRTIIVIVALCVGLVYYGIASPTQIKDTAKIIADNGISAYTKVANSSENIRINDKTLEIMIEGKWYNIASISSIVQTDEGVATVNIEGEDFIISDSKIISLLKSFK